jgi:hypothetical protein
MEKIYHAPSFYAHIINGILLFFAIILLYKHYTKIVNLDPIILFILILIISISIGIHGLMHLGLENVYGYNPMTIIYKYNNY